MWTKLLVLTLLTSSLFAENVFMGETNDEGTLEVLKQNTEQTYRSTDHNDVARTEHLLSELYFKVREQEKLITRLNHQLTSTKDPAKRKTIQAQLEKENTGFKQLNGSLLQLSVGSVDINDLENEEKEKINLNKSLEDIFEPFAMMLMRFTQTPRKIEQLTSEIETIKHKNEKLNIAINNLKSYKMLTPELQAKINEKLEHYSEKRLLLFHKLNSLNLQLEKLEKKSEKPFSTAYNSFLEILYTQGLTVLYAILVFAVLSAFALFIKKLINLYFESKNNYTNQRFAQRLVNLLLNVLSGVLAIMGAIFVIYIRADWLILAIVLFVLLAIFWSLKNALPQYLDEIRMMLNIGVVRENERVIYKGVPYKITRIGLYGLLENPALSNAKIRMPLKILETLISRETERDEVWFPTRCDDYVFVNKTYGKVLSQTPETVTLQTFGTAIKTYKTAEFLTLKPTNISKNGFSIIFTISIDYKHQLQLTTTIKTMLEKGLNRAISHEPFAPFMQRTWIEFNEAKINSLDLKVISTYAGEAAESYYFIERTLRRGVLETCNNNGWKMPYPQLEVRNVHLDKSN